MKPRRGGRFDLRPIGVIRSTLKKQSEAPKQGSEGAPEAWIEIEPCRGIAYPEGRRQNLGHHLAPPGEPRSAASASAE